MTPDQLPARWREEADLLARYGADQQAAACRRHSEELESALRALAEDVLDLRAAAVASGYSVDRLRHMVRAGVIPNAGAKGRPRIRRGDLPRKPAPSSGGFDAAAAASRTLRRRPA